MPIPSVVGLLLAAGRGRRFDPSGARDKLLQCGEDRIPIAVKSARSLVSQTSRCVAVVRPEQSELARLLIEVGCEVVHCQHADSGMAHSLRAGLLASEDAAGWLVALADMPRVSQPTLERLRRELEQGARIVLPFHGGQRGNPVGFGAACLPELLALQGDQGARSLLQGPDVLRIDVDDAGILQDVDRPEDLPA